LEHVGVGLEADGRPGALVLLVGGPGRHGSGRNPALVLLRVDLALAQHSDSAFTTDTPTPWSPPDTLYESLSNLPPAWSVVMTTSSAGFFVVAWMSVGIPRPLSRTLTLP